MVCLYVKVVQMFLVGRARSLEDKMEEMDIINILENLVDEEFKKFKWHLKNEKVDDIEPIHLLDHLLDGGMINEGEMEVIGGTGNRADKARAVIDTVRRKGPAASSVLISALREVDPCLSKELNLM
ncbi:hypothetical protein Q8A73_020781 [Channa argus]|nr:hypothetical protein Q8A73_020781 [Channa argus]